MEQYVKQGKLHYVLAGGRAGFAGAGFGGGGFAGGGGGGGVTSVLEWVEQNCMAVPASAYSATANTGAVAGRPPAGSTVADRHPGPGDWGD